MNFSELGLNEQLIEAISYMGYEKTTPIQEMAIPPIMEGRDLIGCAQTGTGKTAAFILPILHMLIEENTGGTRVLILVPTRELALQIDQQVNGFSYFTNVSSLPVYGGGNGVDWEQERRSLSQGAGTVLQRLAWSKLVLSAWSSGW